MIKPFSATYYISVGVIVALIAISSLLLTKTKLSKYKNLLLYFLAYFMLFVNLFFVITKFDWLNLNLHVFMTIFSVVISKVFAIALFLLYKYKNTNKFAKPFAVITSSLIIITQITLMIVQGKMNIDIYFFAHLCNQMSWLLALCILAFKENTKLLNFAYYGALIGGIISLAYLYNMKLTTTILHFDFFRNVFGHGALIWASLFLWFSKSFIPNTKNLWVLPAGLSVSYVYAFVANTISLEVFSKSSNYLYLNKLPVPYINSYMAGIIGVWLVYLTVYMLEKYLYKKQSNIKSNNK